MSFASSRARFRITYVIAIVTAFGALFCYGFSVWSATRKYDALLPKDASDSIIRGLLAYHEGAGSFPKTFVEVEQNIWKHKKPPNFGENGRTLTAYNYNYILFQLGAHECALYAIPGGERRGEVPSYYFYINTQGLWKWKGPAMREEDVLKLKAVRPGTQDALLLGVLGMTEQPKTAIQMPDKFKKASIVNFVSKD
ncbi:MAG: hypothetical protein ACJ74Q_15750 [Pyrinomonadaceae bacterium]